MLEKIKKNIPIIIVAIVLIAGLALPELIETAVMYHFAKPLHDHQLAGEDIVLHKGVQYQLDGKNKIAVVLLRTDMTAEETEAYYSDILDTEFAKEKDILLDVAEVAKEDAAIDLIKDKGYYDETLQYYYVYIYSDSMAKPLFAHSVAEGSRVLEQDVMYAEDSDRKTVYLHLETEMTVEETEAFYADVLSTELAQKEGYILEVAVLDHEELELLQGSGEYHQDMNYYSVSVYTP